MAYCTSNNPLARHESIPVWAAAFLWICTSVLLLGADAARADTYPAQMYFSAAYANSKARYNSADETAAATYALFIAPPGFSKPGGYKATTGLTSDPPYTGVPPQFSQGYMFGRIKYDLDGSVSWGSLSNIFRDFYCPNGGALSGASCVDAPSCGQGQTRDPATGECATKDIQACPTVSNPVQVALGNKFQSETDYVGSGSFPLLLARNYNSISVRLTQLGAQWRHSYERSVRLIDGATPAAYVYRACGDVVRFVQSGANWVADADVVDKLSRLFDGAGQPIGWTFTDASDDSVESYDASGRLLSIANRAGMLQRLTYKSWGTPAGFPSNAPACAAPTGSLTPGVGLLWCVTDPAGKQVVFNYDAAAKRVSKIFDPAGNALVYTYNANGYLTSVTYPDTKVRGYIYNESANTSGTNLPFALTGITDENTSRYATYKYDSVGRAISSEHAGGADKATLSYATGTTTVMDALSTARTYSYQNVLGAAKLASINQPCSAGCGTSALTTYDVNGNLASRIDFNSNLSCYTFDLTRNLQSKRIEGLTGGVCPGTAVSGITRTITTDWDTTFRLPHRIAEPKRLTTYSYDTHGNVLTKTIQATTDSTGALGFSAPLIGTARVWTYTNTYSAMVPGLMTAQVVNGPRTDVTDTTAYAWDGSGNLTTVTNALSHVTSLSNFDPHGRPQTITDPNGLVTTLSYDLRGRLTSRNRGGEITGYTYDGAGQLTQVTLPDSAYLAYTYDAAHRLTQIQDNLSNKIVYTLDAMGNRTVEQMKDPANVLLQTRTRVYNSLNRLYQDVGGVTPEVVPSVKTVFLSS